jgi:DNA repair exonuclease SbcCD ATPase subunit
MSEEELSSIREQMTVKKAQLQSSMEVLTKKIEGAREFEQRVQNSSAQHTDEVQKQIAEQKSYLEQYSKELEEKANEVNSLSGFAFNKKKVLLGSIETLRFKINQCEDRIRDLEGKEKNASGEGDTRIAEFQNDISLLTATVRKYTREYAELKDKLEAV